SEGGSPVGEVSLSLGAQVVGAFAGVAAAHVMFEVPVFLASRHVRSGPAQAFSEFVAPFGLRAVIWGCARLRSSAVPFAVVSYITAAYWFTASTSFANPAVRLAPPPPPPAPPGHLRGDPAGRRAGVHHRSIARGGRGDRALSVARSDASRCCADGGRAASGHEALALRL